MLTLDQSRDDQGRSSRNAEVRGGGAESEGVKRAAVFGSVARADSRPDSDIDIMVELDPDAKVGVWGFVSIVHVIEDRFPQKVDVSEREALRPFVRPSAEREAIYAF